MLIALTSVAMGTGYSRRQFREDKTASHLPMR